MFNSSAAVAVAKESDKTPHELVNPEGKVIERTNLSPSYAQFLNQYFVKQNTKYRWVETDQTK